MDDTPFVGFQKSGIILAYSPLNLLLYLYSPDCAEDIFVWSQRPAGKSFLTHCYLPPSVGNEQLLKVCFCKQAASAEQGEQCGTLHSLNSSWARSWPSPTHFKCIPDIGLEITSAGLRTTALWPIWRSALRNNNSEAEGIHRWVFESFTPSNHVYMIQILLQIQNVRNFAPMIYGMRRSENVWY